MDDHQCVRFLQWSLPRLGYRWLGFRKVRMQVCKRISRRLMELKLPNILAYREYLEHNPQEWQVLDSFCCITISRFYRDHRFFDSIGNEVMPVMAEEALDKGRYNVRCWCVGGCGGEEPYTLQILWRIVVLPLLLMPMPFTVLVTDRNLAVLERAKRAIYSFGTVKELPESLLKASFDECQGEFHLKNMFRVGVEFKQQDIRKEFPQGEFELIFCRNLVFTYFEEGIQRELLQGFVNSLCYGGFLATGCSETLPDNDQELIPYRNIRGIYRRGSGC